MKLLFILFSCALFLSLSVAGIHNKSSLTFGFITTLTGPVLAAGSIPVVDLTLKLINDRNDILNDYTLGYSPILDSKVSLICLYSQNDYLSCSVTIPLLWINSFI